jgi:hypothetical protein
MQPSSEEFVVDYYEDKMEPRRLSDSLAMSVYERLVRCNYGNGPTLCYWMMYAREVISGYAFDSFDCYWKLDAFAVIQSKMRKQLRRIRRLGNDYMPTLEDLLRGLPDNGTAMIELLEKRTKRVKVRSRILRRRAVHDLFERSKWLRWLTVCVLRYVTGYCKCNVNPYECYTLRCW